MRPFGDANVPVPPDEMRTGAFCSRSTSAGAERHTVALGDDVERQLAEPPHPFVGGNSGDGERPEDDTHDSCTHGKLL